MAKSLFSARKQWAAFKIHFIQFDQAQFCKHSGVRQCNNKHNKYECAHFGPITTKCWFIMAASLYNCAIVKQNFVCIKPNLAISVRICPLRHRGVSMHLLNWASAAELLLGDRKFETLPNVYDHCVVTAAQTLVIFHTPTDKYISPIFE